MNNHIIRLSLAIAIILSATPSAYAGDPGVRPEAVQHSERPGFVPKGQHMVATEILPIKVDSRIQVLSSMQRMDMPNIKVSFLEPASGNMGEQAMNFDPGLDAASLTYDEFGNIVLK